MTCGTSLHACEGNGIDEILSPWPAPGSVDVRRWDGMPKPEPRWLTVVIKVALDWRFLIAVVVLIRVLLNR